jgi:hypothetical protein
MQLSATSTVEEVAAVVSDALASAGTTAVLSGCEQALKFDQDLGLTGVEA